MIDSPSTLFLNGSPHVAGNGMALAGVMADALPGAKREVRLYDKSIQPCRGCVECFGDGYSCGAIVDDMPAIIADVAQADFLIMVSPLHFSSLTAPLVAFISRLQPAWRKCQSGCGFLPPRRRLGALVLTAGSNYPEMFRPARSVALAAFNSLSIPFIGMAAAADTDRIPILENAAAVVEAKKLAERMLARG